jgi:uncharacterized protein YgbK (DUF1537 family)
VAALVDAGCVPVEVGGDLDVAVRALLSGRPALLVSPLAEAVSVPDGAAGVMARSLADATHELLDAVDVGTLIIIGGDVAAEVLGPPPMVVGGSVAPGVAWSHRDGRPRPLVLTRAGGFGGARALVELLGGALVR